MSNVKIRPGSLPFLAEPRPAPHAGPENGRAAYPWSSILRDKPDPEAMGTSSGAGNADHIVECGSAVFRARMPGIRNVLPLCE